MPDTKEAKKLDQDAAPTTDGSAEQASQDSPMRLVATLIIVTGVAGAALAGANALTKDRIAAAKAAKKLASIKKVLPRCSNNPVKDAIKVKSPKGSEVEVYRCRSRQPDGSAPVVAVAIQQSSTGNRHKPYSGLIQVMVGIDARTGKVRSFKNNKGSDDVAVVIVKLSETPGLGSKAQDYDFRKAFAGRDLVDKDRTSDGKLWATRKDNPQLGFVDAISGATITSRAVTEIVQKALAVWNANKKIILTKGLDAPPKRPTTTPTREKRP